MLAQLLLRRPVVDEAPQALVHGEHLVDAGAAAVAGLVAGGAAHRCIGGSVRLAALRAEPAHQALRDHAYHARSEQERLDAHVHEAVDGAHRVVGVQRREHEMPREARLHGDLRRFQVADLADHHHVRVLALDGPQRSREAHLDLGVDLGLADAVQVVLDRVLGGHDVERGGVEPRQRGVEGGRLARAGRAGNEDDAVRLLDQPVHVREVGRRGQVLPLDAELGRLVRGDLGDERLDVDLRPAHVDRLAGHAQGDAAVLRQALLGDVQLRHDLHARDDRRMQRARRLDQVAQRAVDAQPHQRARLEGLDVDVGSAFAQRLREQRVDQADDRRAVLAFEQVLDLRDLLQEARQVDFLRQVAGQRGDPGRRRARLRRQPGAVVRRGNKLVELAGLDAPRAQRHPERAAQFGERASAHRHLRALGAERSHHHAVGLGEDIRDHCGGAHRGGRLGDSRFGRGGFGCGAAFASSPRM